MGTLMTWLANEARELYDGLTATNGTFSSTKTFSSVAYITATWVIVYLTLYDRISTEILLVYLGTVAGHNVLLRKFSPVKGKPNDA